MKATSSKESLEDYEDNVEILDQDVFPYTSAVPTDIPDSKIEIVSSSQVTHMSADKAENVVANVKLDVIQPIVANLQEAHEKESLLRVKESQIISIKPSLSEIEALVVTEPEVKRTVDEYLIDKIKPVSQVNQTFIPSESLITTETEADINVCNLEKSEKSFETAKPAVTLKDAINVLEHYESIREQDLDTPGTKKSSAAISFSPLLGISVLEVSEDLKEGELATLKHEKEAVSKLNFNLHESLQVGEVFVEDKSGKYYPELIVPTESARKDVLVSNQLITEVHDVQEREGSFATLKLPPLQEAQVDFSSKDTLSVTIDEVHEKEGELPLKESPSEVKPEKTIVAHSSLSNTVTTSHIKESDFTPESLPGKTATIGIVEMQHTFNIETDVHESEEVFGKFKPVTSVTQVDISIMALDKPIVEETNVHEKEKNLFIKDDKVFAMAESELKGIEPLITSETMQLTSTDAFKVNESLATEKATQGFITENAKIVSSTLVHDKEEVEDYLVTKTEEVTSSLIPNTPISVSETETSECENNLRLNRIPESIQVQPSSSHLLKTPLSHEINTADQIDFLNIPSIATETATEQRDMQKEIVISQTTSEEQLNKLSKDKSVQDTAKTIFVGQEHLNVIETVSNISEEILEPDVHKPSSIATVDVNLGHKIAVVSEVSSRDALSKLADLKLEYDNAVLTSDKLTPLEISECDVIGEQIPLQEDDKPDFKSVRPVLVQSGETLSVTEVIQHEKESEYDKKLPMDSVKATTDVVSRPVAVLSEVTADSSIGFTNVEKEARTSKATVENIPFTELLVSSADLNEKEALIEDKTAPSTVNALININSNQAVLVEEKSSEIAPSAFKKEVLPQVTAKHDTLTSEALIQQEIYVQSSENVLDDKFSYTTEKPGISLTGLQAIEYDQNVIVESEKPLSDDLIPDQQKANLAFIGNYGVETTEVLSQSDNLKPTEDVDIQYKQASTKLDEIYGKTANTEEIIPVQTTDAFTKENVVLHKSDITSVTANTIEETEVIPAETESVMQQQLPKMSNITQGITEMESLITSIVQTVDKESEFEKSDFVPKHDASVSVVPHRSAISTEVLVDDGVGTFDETKCKQVVANVSQDEPQNCIQQIEVQHGEKETEFNTITEDSRKALLRITETTAKEIVEVLTMENETNLKDTLDSTVTNARTVINEQIPLLSTEIVTSHDVEDLPVAKTSTSKAVATHGAKEAVFKEEPFIGEVEESFLSKETEYKIPQGNVEEQKSVGVTEVVLNESEQTFESNVPKSDIPRSNYEGKSYIDVTEVMLSEKEEEMKFESITPDLKHLKLSVDVTLKTSVNVGETMVIEDEVKLKDDSIQPMSADVIMQPTEYIDVSENVVAEKEKDFDKNVIPKSFISDIGMDTHKHLNIEISETSENEKYLVSPLVKEEVGTVGVEAAKSLEVTEITLEEAAQELPKDTETKKFTSSIEMELGKYVTVGQVDLHEKETPISTEKTETPRHTDTTLETSIPLEIQEVITKESEENLKLDKIPSQEKPLFSFDSQLPVTVTDTVIPEKEEDFEPTKTPVISAQHVNVDSVSHITTSELILMEGLDVLENTEVKDQKAASQPVILKEIVISHANAYESLGKGIDKYAPEEGEVQQDIELHKSYVTTEKIVHEESDKMYSESSEPKVAEEKISELKSVQQTEIIPTEDSTTFKYQPPARKDSAIESHVAMQELLNIHPEILENVSDISDLLQIEENKATLEVQPHKSYTVTDNVAHELSENITTEVTSKKQVTEEIMEINPVEQTETIAVENISALESPKLKRKEQVSVIINTVEGLSVQEIVKDDTQDTFISTQVRPVTAEQNITLLSHIQCIENIPELQTDNLKTPLVQIETSTVTPNSITPLVITDKNVIQHETDLSLQESKPQKLTTGITVVNELNTFEEFIDEQTLPYSDKPYKLHRATTKKDDVVDEKHSVTSEEVYIKGKLNDYCLPIF